MQISTEPESGDLGKVSRSSPPVSSQDLGKVTCLADEIQLHLDLGGLCLLFGLGSLTF